MSERTPNGLPPFVAGAFGKARAWFAALSKGGRILLLSTTLAAIAIVATFTVSATRETWAPLFSQLDQDDASALVAKLKELKVPYRLVGGGTGIEVPEAKVHEIRLELAGAGLPRGGGIGFESFDKMKLGATEFEQRVLFRRALEGELARTIGTISAIAAARVHLVLPEKSVFISKSEPASASVVVRLRGGRGLAPGEVASIVHLAATAVPGLGAERVTVVTTEGQMLHRPRPVGEGGAVAELEHDSKAAALESSLAERTKAMLERVLGPGHVDVRVTADVDLARIERVEDHYDPAKTAVRSETRSTEKTGGGGDTVAGIPGVESNLPQTAGSAAAAASAALPPVVGGAGRESITRNYEVDHVSERKLITGGVLKRLTVAVVVDGERKTDPNGAVSVVPRAPEELAKLAGLVKSAVGSDDKRGDVVTIESIPFLDLETSPALAAVAPPSGPAFLSSPVFRKYGAIAGGVLLGLLLLGGLVRSKKKGATTDATTPALSAGAAPLQLQATPIAGFLDKPNEEELRMAAHGRAARDPATAALVLRYWLGGDEPTQAKG
jgi:flagellar M-ring protein FliF